jgi:hypothetical protein
MILARFNAADGYREAATYLDGGGRPSSIVVDGAGDVFVGGGFYGGIQLVNPLQSELGGGNYDRFVAKFSSDCSSLLFSTYFCGPGDDYINGLALDPHGSLLLVGQTTSSAGFPIVNAFQPELMGASDAFVAKIHYAEVLQVSRTSQTLAISWPASTIDYQLESTPSLGAGAVWENVTIPPVVVATDVGRAQACAAPALPHELGGIITDGPGIDLLASSLGTAQQRGGQGDAVLSQFTNVVAADLGHRIAEQAANARGDLLN